MFIKILFKTTNKEMSSKDASEGAEVNFLLSPSRHLVLPPRRGVLPDRLISCELDEGGRDHLATEARWVIKHGRFNWNRCLSVQQDT